MMDKFSSDQAGSAMYAVSVLVILMIEFGSIAILAAEKTSADANIITANDALWWSLVTISTVGYGDHYPVTIMGRSIAIVVIIIGVGLFGIVTGFLANRFLNDEGGGDSVSGNKNNNENSADNTSSAKKIIQDNQVLVDRDVLEDILRSLEEIKKTQAK